MQNEEDEGTLENPVDPTPTFKELSERELQQEMCRLLFKQEKHLKYFSTVLTIYLVLTGIGVALFIFIWNGVKLQ